MRREDINEVDPPYDPDDWGAPPRESKQTASAAPEKRPLAPSNEAALEGETALPSPIDFTRLEMQDLGAANECSRVVAATEPAAKLRARPRGPARIAAHGAAIQLPHAAKLDLVPATFSRSALFRVGGRDDPAVAASAGEPPIAIEAQGAASMTLWGPWPRMRDKAVWEIALEMAKESADAAAPIRVNLSEFANRLGYGDKSGATLEAIWTSLRRLSFCRVEFNIPSSPGARLAGNLLAAARELASKKEIQIDPAFCSRLMGEDYQFAINRTRRARLSTALARWMHDFLSTHSTQERPFDLLYLRELCGYGADKRRFPAHLQMALANLIRTAPEILASYSLNKHARSSERWTVALVCGEEARRFEQPIAAQKRPLTDRSSGRGGVAL